MKVFLPLRPNGSTGWIKAGDVALSGTPYRIVVELGAHRLTLYEGSNAVLQAPVAVGYGRVPQPSVSSTWTPSSSWTTQTGSTGRTS